MTALSTLLGGNRQWSDVPCGTLLPYGGSSAPSGFLLCDGSAVNRTTYSDLFAIIGTTFGAGDSSTTFNLPDLRGRTIIGAGTGTGGGASGTGAPTGGSALTARANGAWLGEETHVLTVAELATHNHSVNFQTSFAASTGGAATVGQSGVTVTGNAGSNTAHNNIQPVIVTNWIIKAVRAFSGSQSFLSRGFIDGLIISNGTDADHDINIAAGACRDSSDAYNMVLASTMTKQIDAAWAAGSAAGGLFSGSVGNSTWYHVFLIRKDADGSIDAGFDTSVTAANKPAGYSTYRRIGSVLTNGSANIIAFKQVGDRFTWVDYIRELNSAALPTSSTLLTISVPLGVVVHAITAIYAYHATAGAFYIIEDEDGGGAGGIGVSVGSNTTVGGYNSVHRTNTSSQLRHLSSAANTTGYFDTFGWIDPRGKDA